MKVTTDSSGTRSGRTQPLELRPKNNFNHLKTALSSLMRWIEDILIKQKKTNKSATRDKKHDVAIFFYFGLKRFFKSRLSYNKILIVDIETWECRQLVLHDL